MSALIDPAEVPELPADPTALVAAADTMASAALTVRQRVDDATTRWSTLPDVFDTPDTASVVTGLHPASVAASDFDDASAAASTALRTLAENLSTLDWTRTRLIDDIAAHRSTVLAYRASDEAADDTDDPLAGWGPYGFSQNDELKERCESLRRSLRAALDECEQDLGRIGDVERASPVMWARAAPRYLSPTWVQQSEIFRSRISMSILHRLATLGADEMARTVAEHPDWLAMLRDHPPAPQDVAAWWRNVDASHAAALITGASLIIGNLEGVAYKSRDLANRTTLTHEIDEARTAIEAEVNRADPAWGPEYGVGGGKEARLKHLRERLDNLSNIQRALDSPSEAPDRQLIMLTDDRPPLAAISIGDLDQASTITYAVPGMGNTSRDMTGWTRAAQNISDEQSHAAAAHNQAVVAWMGYKTPPVPLSEGGIEVMGNEYAEAGAHNLSRALLGFTATRTDDPRLSVVGHSYGTTTASIALTLPETPRVDAYVALGSAGLPASIESASEINADAIYAGQARNMIPFVEDGRGDQWAWVGRTSPDHPIDPSADSFGAQTFGTDGDNGMHPVTDHNVLVAPGEGWGYLDLGTESLLNTALATGGQQGLTPAIPKSETALQQGWESIVNTPGFSL
ncbi:MAG: alpha/beta hydrolase [Microbacterium enclense]